MGQLPEFQSRAATVAGDALRDHPIFALAKSRPLRPNEVETYLAVRKSIEERASHRDLMEEECLPVAHHKGGAFDF